MRVTHVAKLGVLASATVLTAASCPPASITPGTTDATPPAFAAARVGLEPSASSGVRAEFDLNGPDDIIRMQIGSDLALRLTVVAGDPETGITNLTILSELRWRCRSQPGS